MTLLFIHGVNNRQTDESYIRGQSLRNELFKELVSERAVKQIGLEKDVYWGDLGVSFTWNLESIPRASLQSLGATDTDFYYIELTQNLRCIDGQEKLVSLAQTDPLLVLEQLVQPLILQMSNFSSIRASADQLNGNQLLLSSEMGRADSIVMLTIDSLSFNQAFLSKIQQAKSDAHIVQLLCDKLLDALAPLESSRQSMGIAPGSEIYKERVIEFKEHVLNSLSAAKSNLVGKTERMVSLLAMKNYRSKFSTNALLFFGDVFEYLYRGSGAGDTISSRILDSIRLAAANSEKQGEPLVVVTHSFGSMILYDLLTSNRLDDIKIDLWAMAGAQVSLFAEMRLFEHLRTRSRADRSVLGRPIQVSKWLNFYDEADLFSYLAVPVFGKDAVEDIEFKNLGNLKTAHGDYFIQPAFYKRIAEEIDGMR